VIDGVDVADMDGGELLSMMVEKFKRSRGPDPVRDIRDVG
jgi:hypothetical protein